MEKLFDKKIAINRDMNAIRKSTIYKGCIHEDSNCNEIIDAHSIQENGHLDKISDGGEVLGIDFCKRGLSRGIQLDRIGKGKASTFTGFCKYHDRAIFDPIENHDYERNNAEQNFLFSYRAFAMNYYERHSSQNFRKKQLDDVKNKGGANKELENDIKLYETYINVVEKLRIAMNTNLDNRRFDRVYTEVLIWPKNVRTVATTMYFVYKDREGNVINGLNGGAAPLFFTMFPQGDNTFVLLSCLSKEKSRYSFIKNQIVNAPLNEQMMVISNILALNVENLFISPKYWESIPESMQKLFIQIADSEYKPVPMGYYKNLNIFI